MQGIDDVVAAIGDALVPISAIGLGVLMLTVGRKVYKWLVAMIEAD